MYSTMASTRAALPHVLLPPPPAAASVQQQLDAARGEMGRLQAQIERLEEELSRSRSG